MSSTTVNKGSRVRARWWSSSLVSLVGMQPKVEAHPVDVTGVVHHVRADDPMRPTQTVLFVTPEDAEGPRIRPPGCTCREGHVAVKPEHIVAVYVDATWRIVGR